MRLVLFILTLLLASPSLALASDYMRVYKETVAPFGYTELCKRTPSACRKSSEKSQRVELTLARLLELDEVNRFINLLIKPMTDLEKHNTIERWEILKCSSDADCYGDCEEYVLLKRQELIARGWPMSALLITVVDDAKGQGHAVLTVRTSAGDFILDNQSDDIALWHQTPNKRFRARQSSINPSVWYSLQQPTQRVAQEKRRLSAGVRPAR